LRYYENLFIVNPGYEGDSLQNIIDEYTSFITENGGRVYNVDDWGKRRLAYRIAKQKYGSYVLVEFGADGSIITELEESQRLNDAILSYLTVKLDAEPDLSEARKRPSDDEDEDDDEYDEEHEDVDDEEVDEDDDNEDDDEDEDEEKEEEETSDIEEDEDEEETESVDEEDSEEDTEEKE
jgi:small subunit ribosomal protein S6